MAAAAAATKSSAATILAWHGVIDLGVATALCYLAVIQLQGKAFEGVVIGIIEFLGGLACACVAAFGAHASIFATNFRFLMRFWGRGLFFVLFGAIGLGGPVNGTYILAVVIMALGLCYVALAFCAMGRHPVPLLWCGSDEEPPPAQASSSSTAPQRRANYEPHNPFKPVVPEESVAATAATAAAATAPVRPAGGNNPFR